MADPRQKTYPIRKPVNVTEGMGLDVSFVSIQLDVSEGEVIRRAITRYMTWFERRYVGNLPSSAEQPTRKRE